MILKKQKHKLSIQSNLKAAENKQDRTLLLLSFLVRSWVSMKIVLFLLSVHRGNVYCVQNPSCSDGKNPINSANSLI